MILTQTPKFREEGKVRLNFPMRWEWFYGTGFTRESNARELSSGSNVGTSTAIHEFAHILDVNVFDQEMPHIRKSIKRAYTKAIKAGKYKGA